MGVAPSHDDIPPRPNDPSSWKEEAQIPQNSAKTLKPALKEEAQIPQNSAEISNPAWKEETQLPHNCDEILKHAHSPVDRSSTNKLYEQLYAGVYLNLRRKVVRSSRCYLQKYWVDKESKSNCFTLFPRDLEIHSRARRWFHWEEPSTGESFEIAELRFPTSLGIDARLDMAYLSPETNYEVVFVVQLTDSAYGWNNPFYVNLTLPSGARYSYETRLEKMPKGQWTEIPTWPFKASGRVGEMKASIEELKHKRSGLIVKWVIIKPKAA